MRRRRLKRLVRPGAVTAALWTACIALEGDARAVSAATRTETATDEPLSEMTATLEDDPLDGSEGVRTSWVLDWPNVAGADGYEVTFRTSEGASARKTWLEAPPFRLEVARTEKAERRAESTQRQLAVVSGLLSVRVSAHFPDGHHGAPSPWLAVGRTLRDRTRSLP